MGNCGGDDGKPILLVFDVLGYGTHEISTMDGLKLKTVLEELARRIRVRPSRIGDVQYRYGMLDRSKKIKDLNIPNGGVISVKIVT